MISFESRILKIIPWKFQIDPINIYWRRYVLCVRRFTRNNNESYNQLVGKISLKVIPSGSNIIQIAAYIAACIINEGFKALLYIMNSMGLSFTKIRISMCKAHRYAKRVLFKPTFFKSVSKISHKLINRSIWNFYVHFLHEYLALNRNIYVLNVKFFLIHEKRTNFKVKIEMFLMNIFENLTIKD